MAASDFTEVVSVKLDPSEKITKVSISTAPQETYRFVHIPSLIDSQALKIDCSKQIPKGQYACASYVWRDLPMESDDDPVILVRGLEDKDKNKEKNNYLSIPMLRIVCIAAHQQGCEYLWIDKLGIRQDEVGPAPDKAFQMKWMYKLYAQCKVCIVAPGGLTRLPQITERTIWIERAWTLQEAVAPPDVRVLFKWASGNKTLQHNAPVYVEQVQEGVGMSSLKGLLEASMKSEVRIFPEDGSYLDDAETTEVCIFRKDVNSLYQVVGLLGALDHDDKHGKLNALWRCLILRSASYKEDFIFSAMGVMGVLVESDGGPPKYNDLRVTNLLIKFLQALKKKGNSAEWLGLAPTLGPARGFSALPPLPLDRNVGHGFKRVHIGGEKDGYDIIQPDLATSGDTSWWWLQESPTVEVLDDGDMIIEQQAIPVMESSDDTSLHEEYELQRDTPNRLISCSTYRVWDIVEGKKDATAYAVYVGKKEFYTSGVVSAMQDPNSRLLMLVQKDHHYGSWRNVGYAWGDEDLVKDWEKVKFKVGG